MFYYSKHPTISRISNIYDDTSNSFRSGVKSYHQIESISYDATHALVEDIYFIIKGHLWNRLALVESTPLYSNTHQHRAQEMSYGDNHIGQQSQIKMAHCSMAPNHYLNLCRLMIIGINFPAISHKIPEIYLQKCLLKFIFQYFFIY